MNISVRRNIMNPLISPADVKPTMPGFKVEGIFNCGAIRYGSEILLLCRVAESVISDDPNSIYIPIIARNNGLDEFETVRVSKLDSPQLDFSDSREIRTRAGAASKTVYLTSLSHLRIARSVDGVNFTVDEMPTIIPHGDEEQWGMEDPRITQIGDVYYINYTAVSPTGAATSLISTRNFKDFMRRGIIFMPENKDVAIFPRKIGGKYYAMNRPVPNAIGSPDIWVSSSPDLIHWGGHTHLCGVSADGWENGRIGGGAVPVETDEGWLVIYHAADNANRYCLGAMLLDLDNPCKILAKSATPLVEPEFDYEINGFFGNVIFTCGCVVEGNTLVIYYGASDENVCRMDVGIDEIFSHLGYKRTI